MTSPLQALEAQAKQSAAAVTQAHSAQVLAEQERVHKWSLMLRNWARYRTRALFPKLKRRVRKGIPDVFRGALWQRLCGSDELRRSNPGVYQHHRHLAAQAFSPSFVAAPSPTPSPAPTAAASHAHVDAVPEEEAGEEEEDEDDDDDDDDEDVTSLSKWGEIITRDINRTYPLHPFFREAKGLGQVSLFNVLSAFASYDAEVGYCQGMGFIAGALLMYMSEEEAFWTLVTLLHSDKYQMKGFFVKGMPRLERYFYIFNRLLGLCLPTLAAHLKRENIHCSVFASQWFITIFSYSFPLESLFRIWDIYLHEGPKTLLRVALALMKLGQKRFVELGFEHLVSAIKDIQHTVDAEELVHTALQIKLTSQQVEIVETEYEDLYEKRVAAAGLGDADEPMDAAADSASDSYEYDYDYDFEAEEEHGDGTGAFDDVDVDHIVALASDAVSEDDDDEAGADQDEDSVSAHD